MLPLKPFRDSLILGYNLFDLHQPYIIIKVLRITLSKATLLNYGKSSIIILSFFRKMFFGENKLVKCANLLFFSLKPINLIQKCPYIIEQNAFILYIFALITFLPINLLILLGICSTSKLSKYVAASLLI